MGRLERRRISEDTMNMKSKITAIAALALLAAAFCSCDLAPKENVSVGMSAGIAQARAVNSGDPVTTISAYDVIFKKVEIGNSEEDKYTLWESADGETKNVAAAVSFDGVRAVPSGGYKFIRLTIEPMLSVEGSIDDNGTIYSGSGVVTLEKSAYAWGSVLEGASRLSQEIVIGEGSELAFSLDIAGTIAYQGGPASGAVFSVAKPALNVSVQ
jgi:hypothetical protein